MRCQFFLPLRAKLAWTHQAIKIQDRNLISIFPQSIFKKTYKIDWTFSNEIGAGCLIKAVEAAAGRKAVIIGKPEPYISEYVVKTYGLNPVRTLMIGDKYDHSFLNQFLSLCIINFYYQLILKFFNFSVSLFLQLQHRHSARQTLWFQDTARLDRRHVRK